MTHVSVVFMEETDHFTIRDLIFNGGQDPDHPAIESPGYQPLNYRDLRLQILYVVKSLNARGFHRNDRIAIITPAGPETAVCIVAVMAGFTSVPLNTQYKKKEFEEIFTRVGIKAIIVQEGYETAAVAVARCRGIPVIVLVPSGRAGKFDLIPAVSAGSGVPEFATASDIAYILLTSGTTSASKLVSKTQKQSAIGKKRICDYQKITGADRCLHVTPYYHGMGIEAPLLCPLIKGATVICTRDFIPSDFFCLLTTFDPTYYSAGPSLNQGILRELKKIPRDQLRNHSLRYIRSSSGVFPEDLQQELETLLGIPVIDSYGMSEAGLIAINLPPRKGSVGIPCIGSLAILGDNDEFLNPSSVGEVAIKQDFIYSQYEYAPDENKSVITHGWFRTGDMGYLDDDGYLFLTGRKKDLVNKGGEKISPEEIDIILKSHKGVRDAMVFAIPDPVLGEDIGALVVLADARVTEPELRHYLLDRLVQFKIPRKIWFVDEIPRTPTGKPQRHAGTKRFS